MKRLTNNVHDRATGNSGTDAVTSIVSAETTSLPNDRDDRIPDERELEAGIERLSLGLKLHWIKAGNVNTGLSDMELADLKQTLARGWPVYADMRWPKREVWINDQLQMCPPEEMFDDHSVLLEGYRDDANQPGGGVVISRNTNPGGRDGFLPYDYARRYINDALWIGPN